jgi:NitT/TauT family transport system ATP-binding protein
MSLATAPAGALMPDGAQQAIVSVRGIGKTYEGGVEALRDIDLDFPTGALTALLGPSGCGKTTLLKIIAGLLEPSRGEVRVAGRPVTGPGPERAYVFQDFERHEAARRAIEEVGLAGFEERYPHELSGGMRQRVGLARALAVDAQVLLMDEPFSAVDEQTRRKFQEDLLRLRQVERKTFLFVTHSIEEAVYVADRVVLLSRRPGRVSQVIEPQIDRGASPDDIRRDQHYLDTVEEIWRGLRQYVD